MPPPPMQNEQQVSTAYQVNANTSIIPEATVLSVQQNGQNLQPTAPVAPPMPPSSNGNPFDNAPPSTNGNPFDNVPPSTNGNPFNNAPPSSNGNPFDTKVEARRMNTKQVHLKR